MQQVVLVKAVGSYCYCRRNPCQVNIALHIKRSKSIVLAQDFQDEIPLSGALTGPQALELGKKAMESFHTKWVGTSQELFDFAKKIATLSRLRKTSKGPGFWDNSSSALSLSSCLHQLMRRNLEEPNSWMAKLSRCSHLTMGMANAWTSVEQRCLWGWLIEGFVRSTWLNATPCIPLA